MPQRCSPPVYLKKLDNRAVPRRIDKYPNPCPSERHQRGSDWKETEPLHPTRHGFPDHGSMAGRPHRISGAEMFQLMHEFKSQCPHAFELQKLSTCRVRCAARVSSMLCISKVCPRVTAWPTLVAGRRLFGCILDRAVQATIGNTVQADHAPPTPACGGTSRLTPSCKKSRRHQRMETPNSNMGATRPRCPRHHTDQGPVAARGPQACQMRDLPLLYRRDECDAVELKPSCCCPGATANCLRRREKPAGCEAMP